MGNNYDTISSIEQGWKSVINYNLQRLFEAMQNVNFDINKSLMMMEEIEMQQLGHCYFAAFEPTGELDTESIIRYAKNNNKGTGENIENQAQTTENSNKNSTESDEIPF